MKLIVVVDMQNEFLNWQPDEIKNTLPSLTLNYIQEEMKNPTTRVIFTRDTHLEKNYNEYNESSRYGLHCVRGTDEWQLCKELDDYQETLLYNDCWTINKKTFGEYSEFERLKNIFKWEPKEIEVIGLTTNICVLANMVTMNILFPKAKISTIDWLTYGTSDADKQKAYDIMLSMGFSIRYKTDK